MTQLLYMDIRDLDQKFHKTGMKVEECLFVVVSDKLEVEGRYPNIKMINTLMPSVGMISVKEGGSEDQYQQQYLTHLQVPPIDATLAVLLKSAIVDKINVVFVCNLIESEFKYLDLIAKYYEAIYGANMYSLKTFNKALKRKLTPTIGDVKEIAEKINKRLDEHHKKEPEIAKYVDVIINGRAKNSSDKKKNKKKDKKKKK